MSTRREWENPLYVGQRILYMVHELHKLGYQRVRIAPGMSPSGIHWRCVVAPASQIAVGHGARLARAMDETMAKYSSAQGASCFGWEDAREDTPRDLAAKFIERFPRIVEEGRGQDWSYAGWYVQMLGFAERGELPIAYSDWGDAEPDPRWLPTIVRLVSELPMPPGGEGEPAGAET